MPDRLDRTLTHFVDEGRLNPELAADVSREYHERQVDVRQRMAELAGYVGAALATLGIIVIASRVWSDMGQVMRAGIPAVGAVALLVGAHMVVSSVPDIGEHSVRGRLASVMGVVASVLALLATAVAFGGPGDYAEPFAWQMFIAVAVGLAVALLVALWAPGFISSSAVGVLLVFLGVAFLEGLGLREQDFGIAMSCWLLALGFSAAFGLWRLLPPAWLTMAAGVGAWLVGSWILIVMSQDPSLDTGAWLWVGRAAALLLVIAGSWLFARGGEWPWAAGAAIATAMLVGMWSAQTLNAGVALFVAGVVLILVALLLAVWRRAATGESSP
ncbi:MAG: DUF2157 domain-containing protein [Candidatus Nanopelagicales bacterium]